MELHTFEIGKKEFQMYRLDAFRTNSYLLKMKSLLASAMNSGMNTNAASLMALIDESTLKDIIFPLMKDCAVTCTSEKVKLQAPDDMNKLFTGDTLDEFYLVVLEVLKANFAPFIGKVAMSLFGVDLAEVLNNVKAKAKTIGESSLEKTLTQSSGSGGQ